MKKNVKTIAFQTLNDNLKFSLISALETLLTLKDDIKRKEAIINEKNKDFLETIETLKASDTITVNPELVKNFSQGSEHYAKISQLLEHEINTNLVYYSKYIAETPPNEISVGASETFEEHIIKTSQLLKKLSKKRQLELNIIFSRYENGFNDQLRKLETLKSYVEQHQHKSAH